MDYGDTKTHSMHPLPGEDNSNFPWEKYHWDNTVVKNGEKKKKEKKKRTVVILHLFFFFTLLKACRLAGKWQWKMMMESSLA